MSSDDNRHQCPERGNELEDPMGQANGVRLSEPHAIPQCHLLPSRRLGSLPGRSQVNPHEILKRQIFYLRDVLVDSAAGLHSRRRAGSGKRSGFTRIFDENRNSSMFPAFGSRFEPEGRGFAKWPSATKRLQRSWQANPSRRASSSSPSLRIRLSSQSERVESLPACHSFAPKPLFPDPS